MSQEEKKLVTILGVLLGLTFLSWALSGTLNLGPSQLGTIILVIAFIKVRLIVVHFMESHAALFPIRAAFEAWVFGVAGITITLYLL